MIDIYRGGAVVASVHASDSDKVTKKVMGENTLSLSFTLAAPFDFKIGDYLYFSAEKYTLNITPEFVKRSTTIFDYTLLFEGIEYELRKVRLLFATEAMGIGGGADFSLMGNAALFAQVIVANLNRVQTGWTVGSVIESETKNLTFAGDSCLTVINKVATEFSTEYWIGQDKTVNIGKKGSILPVVFEYGLGNGLYSITRTNVSSKDIITRLYPFGSEQNLPKGYAGKRLQIDSDFIESNVDKYGIIESSQNFDDIKPERTGTITGLGADIFTFIDSSMDFDLNAKVDGNTLYLVPGTTAKIHFQSGDLAGYEFELSSYDHASKAFKLIEFTNDIAYKLPNATLKPAIGDTYIILDIYMPQTYVDAAEARLLAKAQESLAQNSEPQLSYKTPADHKFIAEKGLTLNAGDYVGIKDTQLLIDRNIRLVSVTRYLNYPDKYEFDLADTVEPSLTTQILTTLDNTDIVIRQNKLIDPARARRNYKATAELVTMIEVLKAEALLIGNDPAAQFDLSGAVFNANADGDVNALSVSSSVITHNYYPVGNPGTWSMPDYVASALTPTTPYRLYVRASKSNTTAMYVVSDTTIGVEDEQGYYHFPVGILSSVIDGARVFQTTKGYTLITGDSIKTGTFVNKYGQTVLSLDDRTFYGSFTFANGESVQTNITNAQTAARNAATAATNAASAAAAAQTAANAANANISDMAADGKITPVEKKALSQLLDVPVSEFDSLIAQADQYGVYSDPYNDSYYDLLSFVGTLLAYMTTTSTVDRAVLEQKFYIYNENKINLLNAISTAINSNASSAQLSADNAATIAKVLAGAKMLYRDPNFNDGYNGIALYNNSGGTAVSVVSMPAQSDSPSYPNGYDLNISYTPGSLGASPGLGGFTFATQSRAGAIFLVKLIAKIPVGYGIEFASNSIGTGGTTQWLTDQGGSGKWKEYIMLVRCGTAGTFSTTNFFYLTGSNTVAVTWYLCFATVYDATSSEAYEIAAATETSINGGIITSGTIQLGNTSVVAGITGQGGNDSDVRIWCGALYANRAYAPFRVLQSGEVFARKRIELRDENDSGLAGICGANVAGDGGIRFWAGATYANRATAPFRVDKDGVVVMTKANLSSSESGRRLEINSANGIFRFYNSDNKETFNLTEEYVPLLGINQTRINVKQFQSSVNSNTLTLRPTEVLVSDILQGISTRIHAQGIDLPYSNMPTSSGRTGLKNLYVDNKGVVCRNT